MGVEADQQLSGVLKIGGTDLFEHTPLVLHDQQMRHCNGWEELTAKNSLPKAGERIRDENNNERRHSRQAKHKGFKAITVPERMT